MFIVSEIAPPPHILSFQIVFCCFFICCCQCWIHWGLIGAPFSTSFCSTLWYISSWLQYLARFAFHLWGNALGKKMPWYSPIKTVSALSPRTVPPPQAVDANCTVISCHLLPLIITLGYAVINMTCLSLFCSLKPQVRSKLTGSLPSEAMMFLKESWDDQIVSMLLKKEVTSTKVYLETALAKKLENIIIYLKEIRR